MFPPLLRRCPDCGHTTLARRFALVGETPTRVACPVCGFAFEVVDDPRLT